MSGLIDTISSWFGIVDKDRQLVITTLMTLRDESHHVDLQTDDPTQDGPIELTTSIREVRAGAGAGEVVISQPYAGARLQSLVTNQKVRIIFPWEGGLKRLDCTVIGRVKLSTPGGGTMYGYRLTLGDKLRPHERVRRIKPDVVLPDSCISVQLKVLGRDAPIHGVLVDVTAGGCQFRSTNARDRIKQGQQVLMKLELPDPVGEVSEHVSVTGVVPVTGDDAMTLVGLRFREPIPGLRDLLASGRISMAARP